MKRKKKKQSKGAPNWMISWSDMTTLLLTFFITMMSFAEIEGKDFLLVLSSFRGSLGIFTGGYSLSAGRLEELGQNMQNLPSTQQGRALAKSIKKAISLFKPEIKSRMVRVREDERGLVITLATDSFFKPGSAILEEDIRSVLKKVATIVGQFPNFVRIEGHTDNKPPSMKGQDPTTGKVFGYESNWELSSARSVNVLRYLVEEERVESKKLSAVAFGEFRPIADNNTPEGRAYNRRVDIVIVRDKIYKQSDRKEIERPTPDEEWR